MQPQSYFWYDLFSIATIIAVGAGGVFGHLYHAFLEVPYESLMVAFTQIWRGKHLSDDLYCAFGYLLLTWGLSGLWLWELKLKGDDGDDDLIY